MTFIDQSLDRWVRKPYYAFRPLQLAKRISRSLAAAPEACDVKLPWGVSIECSPREEIGRCLWTTGVYEPAVTEVLWRLLDAGETAVDGGANIGYMTSVLAAKTGRAGQVFAFEPHPQVHARLRRNIEKWRRTADWAQITERSEALSDRAGSGSLYSGAGFDTNHGIASLRPASPDATRLDIALTTLDSVLEQESAVGLLKLDVEGHEYEALRGASRLFRRQAIRDVVFESLAGAERSIAFLESFGYTVFRIRRGLLKPIVRPVHVAPSESLWEPPSYLATCDAARCTKRLKPSGWRTLLSIH